MELKNIVLHHIRREENQSPILNLSDHLLDKTDPTVKEFVGKLVKSFSSKNPTYGGFQEDNIAYPFQNLVGNYRTDEDFLTFSIESMKLLEKEIQVPQAKGGYVVFTHYTRNEIEFLITIMLDKSEQFTINDSSLDIQKLKTLDIDKLARANRINFNKWKNNDDCLVLKSQYFAIAIEYARQLTFPFCKLVMKLQKETGTLNGTYSKSFLKSGSDTLSLCYMLKHLTNYLVIPFWESRTENFLFGEMYP